MKRWMTLITIPSVFFAASAFEYMIAPSEDFYSGSKWRNRDRILVPAEGLSLTRDTVLKIDELLLQGPLYTNGFSLKIDALQITFEKGGAIRGYKEPAPEGKLGETGAEGERSLSERGTGAKGSTPPQSYPGVDGYQYPSAIVIFAGRLAGTPIVDGTGQQGGRGGKGGKGGKGGTGGPGRRAVASCYHWIGGSETASTPGGRGGIGGAGGMGGVGGRGGAPIPLVIVSGAAAPAKTLIVSKGGARGLPGLAGDPGDPGDGGPGGIKSVAKCGSWPIKWRRTRDGSGPGPKGPVQTATLGEGQEGAIAPPVDLTVAPFPVYKQFMKPTEPGIARTDMSLLETKRAQLVDAWAQFHWSRTFLFLTLDTLIEVQKQDQAPREPTFAEFTSDAAPGTDILGEILKESDQERLKTLLEFWTANLIVPFQDQVISKNEALAGANQTAIEVVRLLELMLEQGKPSAELRTQLERVRSGAYAQLQGSLASALDSCRLYMMAKAASLEILLNLTSQYGVPVCEGNPDFTLSENVDKPITLFHETPIIVDEKLKDHHKQLSRYSPLLLPYAHAEGFVIVPVKNPDATGEEIQKRLPDRGIWQVPNLGVFMGFPSVTRAKEVSDIGRELFYLQQNLIRIRNR